jgi:hypothetical protein
VVAATPRYVGSVAFGLAVIEMSESVLLRYVNGKYIRESDYRPPKASARYLDHSWTTAKDIPCGRLPLVVYAPYRGVSWSISFQESIDRALTTDISKIVESIEHSTEALVEEVKEEERQAELRRREWEEQQEPVASGGRPPDDYAVIYAALGENQKAINWLQKATARVAC